MEASTPYAPHIEAEPPEWQPRVMWVTARLLPGVVAFFFASFLFAYFYLRLLDVNNKWKIGAVNPSLGLGIAIVAALVASAVALRLAARDPLGRVTLGRVGLVLALLALVLQVVQWTTLGFGAASGGYASVFIGWTSTYAVFIVPCAYWIQTSVATARRARRTDDSQYIELTRAGLEACAFFWAFYVAAGLVAFVVLYLA